VDHKWIGDKACRHVSDVSGGKRGIGGAGSGSESQRRVAGVDANGPDQRLADVAGWLGSLRLVGIRWCRHPLLVYVRAVGRLAAWVLKKQAQGPPSYSHPNPPQKRRGSGTPDSPADELAGSLYGRRE